jgi:hypothetical protein
VLNIEIPDERIVSDCIGRMIRAGEMERPESQDATGSDINKFMGLNLNTGLMDA